MLLRCGVQVTQVCGAGCCVQCSVLLGRGYINGRCGDAESWRGLESVSAGLQCACGVAMTLRRGRNCLQRALWCCHDVALWKELLAMSAWCCDGAALWEELLAMRSVVLR